jgi:putative transposase
LPQRTSAADTVFYAGYLFPPDVISYAVWLYYRFPLSLRMVEELLAARCIELTYAPKDVPLENETVRRWSVKFGLSIARRIRSTALARGGKRHLDEVVNA